MKKTSFVIAILASALLAGACGKKPAPAAPTGGSAEGSAAPAEGSGGGSGGGSGSGG